MRLAAILETMRIQPVGATGYVDNDAVRLAVARGSSLALGHLGKHGEVNFRYLSQCGIVLKRVDTADNIADIFTKVLSAQKMNHLLRGLLEPEVEPESRAVVAHRSPCPAANSSDLGPAAVSLVCACARSRVGHGVSLMLMAHRANGEQTEENEQKHWHMMFIIGATLGFLWFVTAVVSPVVSAQARGRIAMATRTDIPREPPVESGAAPGGDHAASAADTAVPAQDDWTLIEENDLELAAATPAEPDAEPDAAAASSAAAAAPAAKAMPQPPPEIGAWISPSGECMHTVRNCKGLKSASVSRWASFHQQREAVHGVVQAWTKKNDAGGMLCLRERCTGPHDGPCNMGALRKMRWCLHCGGHPVSRALFLGQL